MEQYIEPFIKVCETVFCDLCNTEVKAKRVYFTSKDEYESSWDISGIIGLSGEIFGAVAISLKDITAYRIAKILTGNEHSHFHRDVTDSIGEIVNIVAGNVKKEFEESFRTKISLPSIITGKAHAIIWPNEKTRIICIPFSIFDKQEMCLSIAIDPSRV